MPDTELLTDQQIAEIDAAQVKRRESLAFHQGEYPGLPTPPYIAEMDALIATVKQLRHDNDLCAKAFELDEALRFSEVGNLNALQIIRKLADLQSQLEQLRAENERLRESLATEVAKRVNVNVERMEQSREVSQSKLERTFDDRLSDTQRGSYD